MAYWMSRVWSAPDEKGAQEKSPLPIDETIFLPALQRGMFLQSCYRRDSFS